MFKKPAFTVSRSSAKVLFNFNSIKLKHEWIAPKGYDTGIKVYNRIVGDKVPLILSNKNYVKWYICGPTVYDVSHIGHASCYIRFDIINRILKQFFNINSVIALGITDIDDKIIISSYKQKVDFRTLAKKHEMEFFDELNRLNILKPNFILRVSEHIPDIIEFISKIIKKGQAYAVEDGSVYFNRSSSKTDWKLISPLQNDSVPLEGQKNAEDFALWKGAKLNEPYWESPWGKGRPGWHIECSAMASKVFGSQLDIHGGGIDLVFPHHENEETQSCSYHDCSQWVNYWLHTGELQVMETKMSKSFRNFVPISDFLKLNIPDHLRMFCFMSSYNTGLHYTTDAIDTAASSCNIINRFIADAYAYVKGSWMRGNISETALLQEMLLCMAPLGGIVPLYLKECTLGGYTLSVSTLTPFSVLVSLRFFYILPPEQIRFDLEDINISKNCAVYKTLACEFQMNVPIYLQDIEETDKNLRKHLKNDFSTSQCYICLMQLVRNTVRMLNENPDGTVSRCPGVVAAVARYVSETFRTFGFQLDHVESQQTQDDQRLEFIINQTVNFRTQVRTEALASTDKSVKTNILKACDSLRNDLATVGVEVKDLGKTNSSWSYLSAPKKDKKSENSTSG